MIQGPTEALQELGFTEAEAEAYCELLRNGPCSAYRLAGAIGRAPPNIYQTLENLCRKRAVVGDEAEPRTFRAVPASDLIEILERNFERRKKEALTSLRDFPRDTPDHRFYRLKSVEQVFDRAGTMLRSAREVVLFDLFPQPFAAFRPLLEEAALRGGTVAGISYGDLPRARRVHVFAHPWDLVARSWPGQQVTIITDSSRSLIALLTANGTSVRQAVWTDSVYLSCIHHSGLACEIQVATRKRESSDPISRFGLFAKPPPGLRALVRQDAEGVRSKVRGDAS